MAREHDVAEMLQYLIRQVELHNGHASHNTPPEKIDAARALLADLLIPIPPESIPLGDPFAFIQEERESRLMDAAVQLYPYVAAVLPLDEAAAERFKAAAGTAVAETDVARSLRCVEIAFGMEASVRSRLFIEDADRKLKEYEGERR